MQYKNAQNTGNYPLGKRRTGLFILAFILFTQYAYAQTILYVKPGGAGNNNGSSWANAAANLKATIDAAAANTQIWVAAGTYRPTTGNDRNISFVMKNNLAIYGGFIGNETLLSQRNIANNPTTLSGDLLGDDNGFTNNGDNSYHVFKNYNNGLNNTAIIDGFTISGGNANESSTNATIFPNYFGGGMLNSASSPTISNCSFVGNSATNNGTSRVGGMYNQNNSSPTLTNCSFSGNLSTGFGGGMHNFSSSPTLSNCSFSGNSASNGGGMINTTSVNSGIASNPILRNCIIWGNSSGVSNFGSSNSTYSYCLVEGINPGGTNFSGSLNPLFVNQPPIGLGTSGNLRLQNTSPVINVGSNVLNSSTTDLAGNPRIFGCTIDLGAYENQTVAASVLYVRANASGANNGTSWANAYTSLQSALAATNSCTSITQIWVAAGTYRPTTGNDRNISFVMKNNLAIYGGFNGTETTLTARNAATNLTILSGDLLGNDGANFANNSENSYHVIKNSNNGLNSTAILDGFTISGGNASVANTDEGSGGGMYNSSATPAVSNCVFSGNTAINNGGGFEYGSNTNITLTNCSFIGNTAGNGGGISSSSTLTLNNCNFTGNSAINLGGGILVLSGAALTNCSFSGNNASKGGGMNNNSFSTLTNCSFSGNNASQGGGMYNNLFSQTLRNCIIWGNSSGVTNVGGANTTYSYSLIEGINPGGTNFSGSLNPLFVNQPPIGLGTTGNLRLQACSPVLNMGDNAANTSLTDLDGNPRVFGGIIDLGTYELQTSGGGASASIAMANTTQTLTQGPDTYYAPNCTSLIARVQPLSGSGLTPVSGSVAASVWIEPSQPTYNGRPYVLRHYEITPATNPTGVSGIVTLYFTQAELDAFNNYPINGDVYLPQSPADNLGKANLRIIKYSGTSSNGSGLPGTYANNGVEINPNDADIIWNSTLLRWEVSFATTGFSGFIVTNSVSTILPITLSHFSGTCTNGKKTLQWITQSEQNNKGFEVQASADGRSFSSIGFVAGSGNSSIATSYTFSIINKDGFYRLKQLDADGKYNYSPIVQVNCAASATPIFMYPNPAATLVTVTIPIAEGYSSISIYNALGMLVSTKTITNASTTFAVSNLANGHYVVKLSNKNGQVIVKKLIIER